MSDIDTISSELRALAAGIDRALARIPASGHAATGQAAWLSMLLNWSGLARTPRGRPQDRKSSTCRCRLG
jgi:hypothetical protein